MEFFVRRTSGHYMDDDQPCAGAYKVKMKYRVDNRSFKTLEDWAKMFPKDFKRKIKDKGKTKGGVFMVVNSDHDRWMIDTDLLSFIKKYGDCVVKVSEEYGYEEYFDVEIYDDYRE